MQVATRIALASADLDWLPLQHRALRRTLWALTLGSTLIATTTVLAHAFGIFAIALVPTMVGVFGSDDIVRMLVRRRLLRQPIAAVGDDGTLVRVVGRVVAHETLPSELDGTPGVYRRATFGFGDARIGIDVLMEQAVDFSILDATGARIDVDATQARLLTKPAQNVHIHDPARISHVPADVCSLAASHFTRDLTALRLNTISETMVRAGDEVEVIGFASRVVDETREHLRETPTRTLLRAGRDTPLVILAV